MADPQYQVGDIQDGYRFKGGDVTKQESWEKVPDQAEPSTFSKGVSAVKNFFTGIPEGTGSTIFEHTIPTISRAINKIPVIGETLAPKVGINSLESQSKELFKPRNAGEAAGKTAEQVGEFLIPTGAEEKAAAYGAKLLPKAARFIGPAIKMGTSAVETGLRNLTQGGGFKEGAEGGALGSGAGQGFSALAPAVAESALGITNKMRGYGRTIGNAVLDEIRGVRPGTIAENAGKKIDELTTAMENAVHGATQQGVTLSTQPAHTVLNDAIKNTPRNARTLLEKLNGLRDLMDLNPVVPGQARKMIFSPDELLELKRGIGKEISTWDPQIKSHVAPVERALYKALDSELDKAIPGNAKLNQRISSLIPASKRASALEDMAPVVQKGIHRVAAHTGAGLGAVAGGTAGYREGGIPGMIAGGVTGTMLPELLTSPTTQMTAARLMRQPALRRGIVGGALNFFDRSTPENQ